MFLDLIQLVFAELPSKTQESYPYPNTLLNLKIPIVKYFKNYYIFNTFAYSFI